MSERREWVVSQGSSRIRLSPSASKGDVCYNGPRLRAFHPANLSVSMRHHLQTRFARSVRAQSCPAYLGIEISRRQREIGLLPPIRGQERCAGPKPQTPA